MKTMRNWLFMSGGIAFSHGLLLAGALFFRKRNSKPNRVFALLVFLLSLELFKTLLMMANGYVNNIFILSLMEVASYLIGPLILLYTAIITSYVRFWKRKYLLHLVPAFIYCCLTILFLLKDPAEQIRTVEDYFYGRASTFLLSTESFVYIINFVYIVWAFLILRQYQRKLSGYVSNVDKLNLTWLKVLLPAILLAWLAASIAIIIDWFHPLLSRDYEHVFFIIVSIFIFFVGYWTVSMPEVYTRIHGIGIHWDTTLRSADKVQGGSTRQLSGKAGTGEKARYNKTRLSEEAVLVMQEQICSAMEVEELYLEPDLTIGDLSLETGIATHHISQVINSILGKNFFSFVNEYRIEAAKKKLIESDANDHTILSIAYDVGFSSKSTFNAIFKKFTSMTPSQYRREICNKKPNAIENL